MKRLIQFTLAVLFIISGISKGIAQNPAWILPHYDYGINQIPPLQPLPSPGLPNYDGHAAACASNMQLDASGNILFFVVDDKVYDGEGYAIGDLSDAYNQSLLSYHIKGTAEISIVPVHGNCAQYYIFLAGSDNYGTSPFHAFVAKIDMSLPTNIVYNPNRFGKVEFCKDLQDYVPISYPSISYDVKSSAIFFACSKLRADKTRFVFVSGTKGLYRFKLSASNLQFDNYWSYVPKYLNHSAGEESRGEMELAELTGQGTTKYRLAVSLKMNLYPSGVSAQSVLCLDLNSSGDVIGDTLLRYDYHPNNLPNNQIHPFIHGVEFSPNGKYLYITHCTNQFYPNAFEYFDFSNPLNGMNAVPNVTANQASNFQYSQIEIGKSNNTDLLFLAYGHGLAIYSNPNTPFTSSLNMSAVSFTYPYNMQNVNYYSDGLKSYMLPDQIDGEDYGAISLAPGISSFESYTATSSATWQPGNNLNPWNVLTGDIVVVHDTITVPSGVNLVIKNMTFHFDTAGCVIIKQGGKLTLDNTKFTNLANTGTCIQMGNPNYWQGVQVWGTSNQNQSLSNGHPTYQGMLELKNNSTIEYAHLAAQNWKPNDYNSIGGVIKASNSSFRNNRRDLSFMIYQNFVTNYPSIHLDDNSSFYNTDFISDDDFIEGYPRQYHVSLWAVHGIHFSDCHFANNLTANKFTSGAPSKAI
ncbi:MAG TPA: hypothetical protein VFQ86_03410, partial [Arachidicoccus soli]|nr:hypothetical protein [Arachidicoccus soli]